MVKMILEYQVIWRVVLVNLADEGKFDLMISLNIVPNVDIPRHLVQVINYVGYHNRTLLSYPFTPLLAIVPIHTDGNPDVDERIVNGPRCYAVVLGCAGRRDHSLVG